MQTLNSNNILHRDLKLENILLKDGVIKISDFGFAKYIGRQMAVESVKCGTPTTMAPEIIFAKHSQTIYTKKCDIYSLGVILHELIYKVHPFRQNYDDLKNNHRVHITNRDEMVEDFLRGALEFDPVKRIDWKDIFEHPIYYSVDFKQESNHKPKSPAFYHQAAQAGSNTKTPPPQPLKIINEVGQKYEAETGCPFRQKPFTGQNLAVGRQPPQQPGLAFPFFRLGDRQLRLPSLSLEQIVKKIKDDFLQLIAIIIIVLLFLVLVYRATQPRGHNKIQSINL